jgi:hypothetical protein
MPPRALVPVVFCIAATWSLSAFACINSMESVTVVTGNVFWLDAFVWPVGAVFLNRIVLVNLRGSAAQDPSRPPRAQRFFFLLVGACLMLVLVSVWAGGPLLNLSSQDLSGCIVSRPMLVVLMASPAVFFGLQSVLFKWVGGDGRVALVGLVLSSLLLAVMVDVARQEIFLPKLCEPGSSIPLEGKY